MAAASAGSAPTLQGESVRTAIRGGQLTIDAARVVANDLQATNGVVHVIDQVLMPQELPPSQPDGRLVISVSTTAEEDPRPLAAFVGEWDQSNFWQLNPACLRRMLTTADFEPEGEGALYDQRAKTADFVDRIFVTEAVPRRP